MTREIGRLRRSALVAMLLMGAMFAVGRASAGSDAEARHDRWVAHVCAYPNHYARAHGLYVIPEGCER